MTSGKTKTRRRYDAQLEAQILAECEVQGASVAKVAMSYGINDNVVHRWRQLAREAGAVTVAASPAFVAVALPAPSDPAPASDIHIELRRRTTTVLIAWPGSARGELATFTRELLS